MGGKRVSGGTGAQKPKKRVTSEPKVDEPSGRYLVWRFGRLDYEGDFGCKKLASADAPGLERELVAFQNEPIWSLRRKKWLKFINAGEMTTAGQQRLARINKQEDGLWQLHLTRNKWRVWGYFEDPEFFFLWWDNGHGVATGKSRQRKT